MPHLTFDGLFTADNLAALLTLTGLEIVLGIDNIIFIAILVGRLPAAQRDRARIIGLAAAMLMRIALLLCITWVMSLNSTLFHLPIVDHGVTGKDLVLLVGGLFLVGKSVLEIHHKIETGGAVEAVPHEHAPKGARMGRGFAAAIVQIMLLDIVFSLDSVITAVGMAQRLEVMIVAVMAAVGVMLVFSGYIARFVERHPTIKMLALSFLILIGVMLVADGCGQHVPKGYIYFAMFFSLIVEMLNIWVHTRAKKIAGGSKATAG
jgi:predicted tellurium resistance membrane protein TerC